uniref:Uncharacterized protein n=1 Tax=Ixodes ricinus TaxID=34613 RepID=A0A6B0UPY1_IXORI
MGCMVILPLPILTTPSGWSMLSSSPVSSRSSPSITFTLSLATGTTGSKCSLRMLTTRSSLRRNTEHIPPEMPRMTPVCPIMPSSSCVSLMRTSRSIVCHSTDRASIPAPGVWGLKGDGAPGVMGL